MPAEPRSAEHLPAGLAPTTAPDETHAGSLSADGTDRRRPIFKDKRPARILAAALLIGISFDLLLYGHPLGVSLPVFVAVVLLSLLVLSAIERVVPVTAHLGLVAAAITLAVFVAVRANPFLTLMNLLGVFGLLTLTALYYARDRLVDLPLVGYPLSVLFVVADSCARPARMLHEGVDAQAVQQRGSRGIGPFARGLLLAVPVVVVLVALLSAADLMFQRYLHDILGWEILDDLPEYVWRSMLILGVGWGMAGALALALRRRESVFVRAAAVRAPTLLGFTESAMVLAMVIAVFTVFVWIQFAYMFGGEESIVAEGFTYAEYARRGFFELIAVALISLSLVLGLGTFSRRDHPREMRVFSLLATVVVALVLVMLVSAFRRLQLYEAAFGYTQLRVIAHVFMVWLGAALVWLAATQWVRPRRFAIGAFVCVLGFVFTLNAINPDALIARLNLQRFEQTGDLDYWHLTTLSNDAVPTIVAHLHLLEGPDGTGASVRAENDGDQGHAARTPDPPPNAADIIKQNLAHRHDRLQKRRDMEDWRSWHLAHDRALIALDAWPDIGSE